MTQPITPLRQRMLNDMKLRNMALSTRKIYVTAVAGLRPLAGPAHARGRARRPAAPGRPRAQGQQHLPDHERLALLLRKRSLFPTLRSTCGAGEGCWLVPGLLVRA